MKLVAHDRAGVERNGHEDQPSQRGRSSANHQVEVLPARGASRHRCILARNPRGPLGGRAPAADDERMVTTRRASEIHYAGLLRLAAGFLGYPSLRKQGFKRQSPSGSREDCELIAHLESEVSARDD